MDKIDSSLLKRFQKFSDWIQLWIGVTNFQLAKITLTIGLIGWLETRMENIAFYGLNLFNTFSVFLGALFYFYIIHRIKIGEQNCHQNPLFQSSLAIDFTRMRKWSICFVIFAVIGIIVDPILPPLPNETFKERSYWMRHSIFLLICALGECMTFYFASCTPKPRKPSKVKELLQRIKLRPQLESI